MIFNGTNLIIVIDGSNVANATSVSLEISRELIPVTTKPTNAFIERIPGTRDGNLSFEGFLDWGLDKYNPGQLVSWRFRAPGGVFYGEAYVGSISYNGGTDDAPTTSGSMETTGQMFFAEQLEEELCILGVDVCIDGQQLTAQI